LDTCGFADSTALDKVHPSTDCRLYDLKLMEPTDHEQQTGQSNDRILENLLRIASTIRFERDVKAHRMTLWIRTPLIPGVTASDKNLMDIGAFILRYLSDVVQRWELCAFNNACTSKYAKMGKDWPYKQELLLKRSETERLRNELIASGISSDLLVVTGLVSDSGSV